MKKYEGIMLPIYESRDLEKFWARPAGEGVGEKKDMKHVNKSSSTVSHLVQKNNDKKGEVLNSKKY